MMDTPYYDLLYPEQKYAEECQWIHRWLGLGEEGKVVLDLGCGSARHGEYWAREYDYKVLGVDHNENMLKLARPRAEAQEGLDVVEGDIRHFRREDLKDQCDLVCSLFHVLNFMRNWQDIDQVFQTAAYHLKEGGKFFFDTWGVVDRLEPEVRQIWTAWTGDLHLKRISMPVRYAQDTAIKLEYHLFVRDFEEDPDGDWVAHEEAIYMRPICEHMVRMLADHHGFNVGGVRRGIDGHGWFYQLQKKFDYVDPKTFRQAD